MQHLPAQLLEQRLQFIDQYLKAGNAADGSRYDANANVVQKNMATLENELNKDINIAVNRRLLQRKIRQLFGAELAEEYLRQLNNHEIYTHDESSLKPYCCSISLYPMLLDGLLPLGGESRAPQHLDAFCGVFINLVFAVSSQFAGAVATVEFLTYFDHFARRDYGDDYLNTHTDRINGNLQHVIYSLNQPAAARGYQSVFWNISCFSQGFFESLFEHFVFPDGTAPDWASVERLQRHFMAWFNAERTRALLTYPVVTVALLTQDGDVAEPEAADYYASQLAAGNSFFIYMSDSADSLASCCRLRNELADNSFSYSLGAGGVATGSINVITLNMSRIEQLGLDLGQQVEKLHCYQVAYRKLMEEYQAAGMLPVYDAGYIQLDKQFLTVGLNGLVEAAESKRLTAGNNPEYQAFIEERLQLIYTANRAASKRWGYKFNTELVPAENLGVKNAAWDLEDGLISQRDCYNSYFYPVEASEAEVSMLDKFVLHGSALTRYLDGGSALHLNLDDYPDAAQYRQLFRVAARTGCNYWTTNIRITLCNTCEHIDKRTLNACPRCGSADIDWATRVIGFLKRVSSFSGPRQKEHQLRHYRKEQRQQPRAQPTEIA